MLGDWRQRQLFLISVKSWVRKRRRRMTRRWEKVKNFFRFTVPAAIKVWRIDSAYWLKRQRRKISYYIRKGSSAMFRGFTKVGSWFSRHRKKIGYGMVITLGIAATVVSHGILAPFLGKLGFALASHTTATSTAGLTTSGIAAGQSGILKKTWQQLKRPFSRSPKVVPRTPAPRRQPGQQTRRQHTPLSATTANPLDIQRFRTAQTANSRQIAELKGHKFYKSKCLGLEKDIKATLQNIAERIVKEHKSNSRVAGFIGAFSSTRSAKIETLMKTLASLQLDPRLYVTRQAAFGLSKPSPENTDTERWQFYHQELSIRNANLHAIIKALDSDPTNGLTDSAQTMMDALQRITKGHTEGLEETSPERGRTVRQRSPSADCTQFAAAFLGASVEGAAASKRVLFKGGTGAAAP